MPLHTLEISDVRFRSFMDLYRLVWELPDLEIFVGTRLTWSDEAAWPRLSAVYEALVARRSIPPYHSVDLNDAGQLWPPFWLAGFPNLYNAVSALFDHLQEQFGGKWSSTVQTTHPDFSRCEFPMMFPSEVMCVD